MKKQVWLGVFFLFFMCSGCATPIFIPQEKTIVGLDFSKYQKKGFLITPGEYGEDYDSVSYLYLTVFPEAKRVEKYNPETRITSKSWFVKVMNYQELLDMVYSTAISRGANALTHLKIKSVYKTPSFVGAPELEGIEVSGLLIKRN